MQCLSLTSPALLPDELTLSALCLAVGLSTRGAAVLTMPLAVLLCLVGLVKLVGLVAPPSVWFSGVRSRLTVVEGLSFVEPSRGDQHSFKLSALDCDCEDVGDVRSVLSDVCESVVDAVRRRGAAPLSLVVVLVMDRLSESCELVACTEDA